MTNPQTTERAWYSVVQRAREGAGRRGKKRDSRKNMQTGEREQGEKGRDGRRRERTSEGPRRARKQTGGEGGRREGKWACQCMVSCNLLVMNVHT